MSKTLKSFMVLMVAHWAEHLYQAYQVWGLHMPRQCAMGILGTWFPILMTGEYLHFGFAILTFLFVAATLYQFNGQAGNWWKAAYLASAFHLSEHVSLFMQAQTGHFWFGRSVPTSLIQYLIPRIELHLFYNTIVTVLVSVGMYYKLKTGAKNEKFSEDCSYDSDVDGTRKLSDVSNHAQATSSCSCANRRGGTLPGNDGRVFLRRKDLR